MSASSAEAQRKAHGIYFVQEVIGILQAVGHVCCVTGVKALRYYGAARVSDEWRICVPNSDFAAATQLIDSMSEKFERVDPPMPQLRSLIHTYPRYRSMQEDSRELGFFIMPSSEDFLGDLNDSLIERSPNNVPYPNLEVFVQDLVSIQKWDHLAALVDGMNLSLEWGLQHLRLGTLSEEEMEHCRAKIAKYSESLVDPEQLDTRSAGGLTIDGIDKSERWATIVSQKQLRARSDHYLKANWKTRFMRNGCGDPRFRPDRPV
ncbi:hypothetical protein B0A48_03280 [Cryoendolithus antarcticus]|uniref:Uncharacterized protein n=1 Tax=Cryoendolithus antarcticus TaxID=1507870 RepID=A0A1V8TJJ2_9PEZI|nr:hypothetical protein B0A48_03280 [Cryoendolithus antarcticus]